MRSLWFARAAIFLVLPAGTLAPSQTPGLDATWVRASTYLAAYSRSAGNLVTWSQGSPVASGNWGIGVDGQMNVWATDYAAGSNTVSRFSVAGAWTGTFVAGPAAGPTDSSVGPLAIDRQGFVYVGDPRSPWVPGPPGRITKLDGSGAFVATLNLQGRGVNSLVIDPNGDVWVALYGPNPGYGPVQKYSPTGTFLLSTATFGSFPNILYADEWGRILASHHPISSSVTVFGLTGNVLSSFSGGYSGSVAAGLDGNLWWCGSTGARKWSATGTPLSSLILHPSWELIGMSFDSRGDVWFCGRNAVNACRLAKHLADGTPAFTIDVGPAGPAYNLGDMTGMLRARTIDPTGDMDGDGWPNYSEVLARTSPMDPAESPGALFLSAPPVVGTQVQVGFTALAEAGRPWFFPWSTNPAPFALRALDPLDPREFPISFADAANPLALDPVWSLSVGPHPFTTLVFPDTFGIFDASGSAMVRINLPPIPALVGWQIHGAICALHPPALSGVSLVSPRLTLVLQ